MFGVKEVLYLYFLKLSDTYTTLILHMKGHTELNPLLREIVRIRPELLFLLNAYVLLASLLPMLVQRSLVRTLDKKDLGVCERVIDYGFCCMILLVGLMVVNNIFIVVYNYGLAGMFPSSV